jgi:hypothetical protein
VDAIIERLAKTDPTMSAGSAISRCPMPRLATCTAHGLRKAGASIAAESGATEHQLMAIVGWATSKEAERYTKTAKRKKMAGDAMTCW